MTLRQQYPREYECWKALRRRERDGLAVVHPTMLETFEGFFDVLGPMPEPGLTVNRIDNDDPQYGPGKVEWASDREQATNRSNTHWVHYTGTKYPQYTDQRHSIAEWARLTSQNAGSMRRHAGEGWTDNELVDGARAVTPKTFDEMSFEELIDYQPWHPDSASQHEASFQKYRQEGETRFEYWVRVIVARGWDALRTEFADVALDMHYDQERFLSVYYPVSDPPNGTRFFQLPNTDNDRFLELLAIARPLEVREAQMNKDSQLWLAAIQRKRKPPADQVARTRADLKKRFRGGQRGGEEEQ